MNLGRKFDIAFRLSTGEVFFRRMDEAPPFIWIVDKSRASGPTVLTVFGSRDREPKKFRRVAHPAFAPASEWGFEEVA